MPATDSNKMWADLLHDDPAASQDMFGKIWRAIMPPVLQISRSVTGQE
ncbi:hypothetical protein [Yersinia pekkanenii]|uniref:Uncharacterized protein n=1 Tax=Yersinia pekkanenii TaxID=1288385 RepID=A0A0T9PAD6_9GAMM|nr:hypothetical protein [Yersinia pekkanenii]CNH53828.1 Uncharacterised protein [Yersinia pekkanenii]CRY67541.1 Uncharacterised protein [Yersinia pekkanenii]